MSTSRKRTRAAIKKSAARKKTISASKEHTKPGRKVDDGLITDFDSHLFNEGTHRRIYEKLGSHPVRRGQPAGTHFAVWAPNAKRVSVIGDFNGWDSTTHLLTSRLDSSGIWEGFINDVGNGALYKYHIESKYGDYVVEKGDPYAFLWETSPRTASVVWELDYEWHDADWIAQRAECNALDAPMSIYEVHLGSWQRKVEEGNRSLTYRELAASLTNYVKETGFTHVEILPVMEHPFYGSWGYQIVGYFAPTSRYGTPQDFMYLIDTLHRNGIGVILDWVPSHFPSNENGLVYFDGTHLYEHADVRQGYHPEWKTYIFNYGRNEVASFLISNALFWLDKYHVDGFRVDAVASMLYLDYSRKEGEWVPNRYGGRENIEAIEFLRKFNKTVFSEYPDVQTIAEESTSWPGVSRPVYAGGLGFGLKWKMGWMHDTLSYMANEPIHRKYHHDQLTFSMLYAYTENFVLPLSHDEIVYGKGSLVRKMPGDEWQKFANLRLLLAYQYFHPGKNLLFMGGEFGQWSEWNHDTSLDWHLLASSPHDGLKRWVTDLNRFYRQTPALYQRDFSWEGFDWVDCSDYESSVISFIRKGADPNDNVLVVCNFTPVVRHNYKVGVSRGGSWREVLNSDAVAYGGSGQGNLGGVEANPVPLHGRLRSVSLCVPPLAVVVLVPQ